MQYTIPLHNAHKVLSEGLHFLGPRIDFRQDLILFFPNKDTMT